MYRTTKKCLACGHSTASGSNKCLTCGLPWDIVLPAKTAVGVRLFYKGKQHEGGWFDLKIINGQAYLYARWKDGTIQRSKYIGKVYPSIKSPGLLG